MTAKDDQQRRNATREKLLKPVKEKQTDTVPARSFHSERIGPYQYSGGKMVLWTPKKNHETGRYEEVPAPLSLNFCYRFARQLIKDDGGGDNAVELEVEVIRTDDQGHPHTLPAATIPSSKIHKPRSWIMELYGAGLRIAVGQTTDQHLTLAAQMLSGEIHTQHVYQHTGFRQVAGRWIYLSTSGALSADGLDDAVTVDLGHPRLNLANLPAPRQGHARDCAWALLDLLTVSRNKGIGAALVAAGLMAILAEVKTPDFCVLMYGRTGSRKSSVAAVAQSWFGPGFADGLFPSSFANDTKSALERKAFLLKDALHVADETKADSDKKRLEIQDKFSSFCQNTVGNGGARDRLGADARSQGHQYHPRGMTIITGEDLPSGQSLLGRLLLVEVRPDDIDNAQLSTLQAKARNGTLAEGAAGYIQWLCPRIDALKRDYPSKLRDLRDEAIEARIGGHARAPGMYAHMVGAYDLFLNYLIERRIVSEQGAADLLESHRAAVIDLLRQQIEHQEAEDELRRFIRLLKAVLDAGEGHFANAIDQAEPKIRPAAWGWRKAGEFESLSSGERIETYKAMGATLGWLSENDGQLWLQADATFKAVVEFAGRQRSPLLITQARIWRRLMDEGVVLPGDFDRRTGRHTHTTKRDIGGQRRRIVVMPVGHLEELPDRGKHEK